MKLSTLSFALIGATLSSQVNALNIVLTNDDSWETDNIQIMAQALTDAGHDVIMSAPCTGQSGKGGAVNFLQAVSVDTSQAEQQQYCVGDTDESVPFEDFVEGTPVMSVLYGLDVAAQAKWNAYPDLVISGPNEGNNLGYLNNNSGTLGATMVAIARGIPAIAVSADDGDAAKAQIVASKMVAIVAQLEQVRQPGHALLPAFTGLNVNTPEDISAQTQIQFTDVGWSSGGIDPIFVEDLSQDQIAMSYIAQGITAAMQIDFDTAYGIAVQQYTGQSGISIDMTSTLVDDSHDNSEGNAVKQGFITISTIDAHVQASRAKVALTKLKLAPLAQTQE